VRAFVKGGVGDIHVRDPAAILCQFVCNSYVFFAGNGKHVPGVWIASSYLNVKILVDFDHVAEEENVLHQTGKLPHIPQVFEGFGGLGCHLWLGG
jgi:hypothetical protein